MQDDTETPLWMRGNYAPVREEVTAFDLPVEGNIPPELRGLYARNSANPREGVTGHWFLGDGMVHGVSIRDGKAEWYRNRWVRTPCFFGQKLTVENALDIRCSVANTSVVPFANRIFTLAENALPMEITRELDTVGFHDFGGALKTPFTAHPKMCPLTGELHFFGYRVIPPFLTYQVASAEGTLLRSLEVPVKGPTMMHDFALTWGHAIFMELPVVFDLQRALNASIPFTWSESYGARLGVLPRGAGIEKLRWVEVAPCYVYHVANAFEAADGTICLDVARYESAWRPDGKRTAARLSRWRIPPGASKAEEEQLDDQKIEFPRIDDRNVGRPHATVYALANNRDVENGSFGGLLRYDLRGGETQYHDFGEAGRRASLPWRRRLGLERMRAGLSALFMTARETPATSRFLMKESPAESLTNHILDNVLFFEKRQIARSNMPPINKPKAEVAEIAERLHAIAKVLKNIPPGHPVSDDDIDSLRKEMKAVAARLRGYHEFQRKHIYIIH